MDVGGEIIRNGKKEVCPFNLVELLRSPAENAVVVSFCILTIAHCTAPRRERRRSSIVSSHSMDDRRRNSKTIH